MLLYNFITSEIVSSIESKISKRLTRKTILIQDERLEKFHKEELERLEESKQEWQNWTGQTQTPGLELHAGVVNRVFEDTVISTSLISQTGPYKEFKVELSKSKPIIVSIDTIGCAALIYPITSGTRSKKAST